MLKKFRYIILPLSVLFLISFFFYYRARLIEQKKPLLRDKVTIAAYSGDSALLVYLAKQKGFFKDYGIDVQIKDYEAGVLALRSLTKGEADLATASEAAFVSGSFKQPGLRILSVISEGKINKLIAWKNRGIEEVGDLFGRRIATTKGSTGEYYLARFLGAHYLDLDAVELIDLAPSQIVDFFAKGKVDAAFSWEPNIYTMLKASGEKAMVWDAQEYNYFYFLLLTRQDWINQNPELAQRLLKALIKAEEILIRDDNILARVLQDNFDYSDQYLQNILGCHRYYVYLPQSLLLELEHQTAWQIEKKIVTAESVPNYLGFIYPYALEAIDPLRVTVIR